jgi:hypothetical protein
MTSRYVIQAPVLLSRIIEADPAREVCKRFCPGPIRIVLVPGNNTAVPRRLAKQLVMPEPDSAA